MDEPEKESLVIGSKIKAYVKERGLMCSGELPDAVSAAVRGLLDKACERTKENKRSTVRPYDI